MDRCLKPAPGDPDFPYMMADTPEEFDRVTGRTPHTDAYRLDPDKLGYWRAQAGQAGINAWCLLHGLNPDDVAVDHPIEIHGDTLTGTLYLNNERGYRYRRPDGQVATEPFERKLIQPPPPSVLELLPPPTRPPT